MVWLRAGSADEPKGLGVRLLETCFQGTTRWKPVNFSARSARNGGATLLYQLISIIAISNGVAQADVSNDDANEIGRMRNIRLTPGKTSATERDVIIERTQPAHRE